MADSDSLVDLVRQLEGALAIVASRTKKEKLGVTLQKADLRLKVATKKSTIIGGKIEWGVSVDVSAGGEWSRAHTLVLSLIPKVKIEMGKPESEELADTIFEIASAISTLQKTVSGHFNASEASISIDVEQSKNGKVQVVAGGGAQRINSHTVELSFRPT
jgi:hypothetical protein